MYEKLLSVVILTPDILLCFNLSGTINLDNKDDGRIVMFVFDYN